MLLISLVLGPLLLLLGWIIFLTQRHRRVLPSCLVFAGTGLIFIDVMVSVSTAENSTATETLVKSGVAVAVLAFGGLSVWKFTET